MIAHHPEPVSCAVTCCLPPSSCGRWQLNAAEPVDVALVMVTDVSRSIDDSEFDLEKQGYAAAFTDRPCWPRSAAALHGAIAVDYVEFASEAEVRTVLDWTVIHDEASAQDFVGRLAAAPRIILRPHGHRRRHRSRRAEPRREPRTKPRAG